MIKNLVILLSIFFCMFYDLIQAVAKPMIDKDIIIDLVSPLVMRGRYLEEYKRGGVTVVGVTLAVNDKHDATIQAITQWNTRVNDKSKNLTLIRTASDITKAYKQDKLGIIYHFQNSSPLDDNIDLVKKYYDLGVRVMQITYNTKNTFGSGCMVENDTGLTKKGYELIKRMNNVGTLVDVSHAGYKTALDVIRASTKPVILSHSNALALCDCARNVPDEIMKATAKTGGVIGVSAFSPFLTKTDVQANLDQFLNHIDYIVQLVGVDHVSLGLDYHAGQWPYISDEEAIQTYNLNIQSGRWNPKNYPKPPHKYASGLETPDKIGNLKPALLKRGYSEIEIEKILGKNLIRVFAEVWK